MAGSPLKRARRLAAEKKIDPLDEAPPRPKLAPIPWNKVELTDEQRALVARVLAERHTRAEIAAALGVSAHTLRRLIRDNPALTEAVETADEAELEEIRSLLMAHGRAGDTVALIFLGKAFHGLRDRDDVGAAKIAAQKGGGVLLLPADVRLDEWEAAAAAQQAQYRERPQVEPVADFRTRSIGVDGLIVERTLTGDLP
jgi:DNA-binding CsgD family transcriptional regulator